MTGFQTLVWKSPTRLRPWSQPRMHAGCCTAAVWPARRMVGAGRFELPTPCSRSKCATRLRYAPPDQESRPQRGQTGTRKALSDTRIKSGRGGFIAMSPHLGKASRRANCSPARALSGALSGTLSRATARVVPNSEQEPPARLAGCPFLTSAMAARRHRRYESP